MSHLLFFFFLYLSLTEDLLRLYKIPYEDWTVNDLKRLTSLQLPKPSLYYLPDLWERFSFRYIKSINIAASDMTQETNHQPQKFGDSQLLERGQKPARSIHMDSLQVHFVMVLWIMSDQGYIIPTPFFPKDFTINVTVYIKVLDKPWIKQLIQNGPLMFQQDYILRSCRQRMLSTKHMIFKLSQFGSLDY